MPRTAILIGDAATCRRLERQLDLLDRAARPTVLGWVLLRTEPNTDGPFLGTIEHLEAIVAHRPPGMALICLPAVCKELIASIRTRLRRMGIPDRFVPSLEDLVEGVGPRTNIEIDVARLLDRPPRHMDEAAVRSVIAGQRIAVTGAGGSIGGELARIIARFEPAELLLIERSENALFEIDRQIARHHPEVRRRAFLHDVVRREETLDLFHEAKPDVIFHTAAHKHVSMMEDHPRAAIDNNLFGTISVADAATETGAGRFVFISTDKAVNPASIMGASKRLAELYVQSKGSGVRCQVLGRDTSPNTYHLTPNTLFSIVRFGNVLGSSGSVLEIWARQIADGGPVTITDPNMTRYFMTIPEAASLVIQSAALAEAAGEVFLLDMGEPVKILELARRFIRMHGLEPIVDKSTSQQVNKSTGQQVNRVAAPNVDLLTCGPVDLSPASMPIVFTGIRPGEKLHEDLAEGAEHMRPTRHPDITIWMLPPPPPEFVHEMVRILSVTADRAESASELTEKIWALLGRAQETHVFA